MRQSLSAYINVVITFIILLVVAVTPLLFTSTTTEFYETPKIILIVAAVLILLVLWSFTWILQGKVLLTRTPLDIPLLILLAVVILSTLFSDSRYVAIFGDFPRIHGSAVTWVSYILFYFISASHLRTQNQTKLLSIALILSGTVAAVITLLSYFSIFLPLSFTQATNFTPTGSSFSTTALLALLLPFPLLSLVSEKGVISKPISVIIGALFGITIALTGIFATQIAAILVVVIVLLAIKKTDLQKSAFLLLIPVVLSLLIWVIGYIPGNTNVLYQDRINFSREISPSFSTSWKVAASTFRDYPFLGTGPSTYLFNYTAYKPIEVNSSPYWNISFDTASNEYLQELGTMGGAGIIAIVLLSAFILSFGWTGLSTENVLAKALSVSAIIAVVIMALHVTTVVMIITMIAILAMLMAVHKSISGKVEELSIGIKASKLTDSNLVVGDILPYILFLPIVILVAMAGWQTVHAVQADTDHRLALNAASTRGKDTYDYLVAAQKLNPYIDVYYTDLARTDFILANTIASNKGPSAASPAGSLTDDDKTLIQQLLSQSITEARTATALSPRNAQNWEVLASIYSQISGVAKNATDFALDAYGHTITLDPLNPNYRLDVGGIYYSAKNYDLAVRFFSDATNLKPDFANAYYNLSITLRDKGDLTDAQTTAEKVVSLLQSNTNSQDYKTASSYLADLKARIATGSAGKSSVTPPAAGKDSAVDNTKLNNPIDLGNKPDVSTPDAVQDAQANR